MLNLITVEGWLFKRPEEISMPNGSRFYRGNIVSYRDAKSGKYDFIDFVLGKDAYKLYLELIADKKARILITGALRTFKGTVPYIEVKYFALYPFSTNLKGGAKENVEEEVLEEPEVAQDDSKDIPDDAMSF